MNAQKFAVGLTFFCMLLVGASGCDGDDNARGRAGSEPGGSEAYRSVLDAFCGVLDRCPAAAGGPVAYRSRQECMAIFDFTLSCSRTEVERGGVVEYGVREVRAEVSEAQAQACIAWLESANCGAVGIGGAGNPCSGVLRRVDDEDEGWGQGRVGEGERCRWEGECQGGLYCLPEREEQGGVSCRVCVPRLGEGAACDAYSSAQCAEGLRCASKEGGEAFWCAPLGTSGGGCYQDEECEADLFCNTLLREEGDLGWGRCDAGGRTGDSCREAVESVNIEAGCRRDFFCDDGVCQARRAVGEVCERADSCLSFHCDAASGLCGKADGEPCSQHGECISEICDGGMCGGGEGACMADEQCGEGEFCAGLCRPPNCSCSGCPVGTCQSVEDFSQSCRDDFDCDSYRCQGGRCMPPAQAGESCSDDMQCYPTGYCSGGVCVERHAPGQECTRVDSCQEPFLCVEGRCRIMNLVCKPARAGELCAAMRVCDEDSYCDLMDGVRCKARDGAGEACSASRLTGDTCAKGYFCGSDGDGQYVCQVLPKLGEACSGTCADGHYCHAGVCMGAPVGRSCVWEDDCPAELFCHGEREVCVPRPGKGEACNRWDSNCLSPYVCGEDEVCGDGLGVGESCSLSYEDCGADLYCAWDDSTCQAVAGVGEACDHRVPCKEGLQCSGQVCEEVVACLAAGAP